MLRGEPASAACQTTIEHQKFSRQIPAEAVGGVHRVHGSSRVRGVSVVNSRPPGTGYFCNATKRTLEQASGLFAPATRGDLRNSRR